MDEKELKKRIEEQTGELEIPESLQPERIEKELSKKKKNRRKVLYGSTAAAAAVLVCVVGLWQRGSDGNYSTQATVSEADSAEVTESGTSRTIMEASDYDDVYDYLEREETYGYAETEESTSSADSSVATDVLSTESNAAYYDTNTREEDVGEADIVKTDGSYIYLVNGQTVQIVDVRQQEMEASGEIDLAEEGEDIYVSEIYVGDGRVTVFYTKTEYETEEDSDSAYGSAYQEYTIAETFDVSDPSAPVSVGMISQSGSYNTMREVDGFVYVFSDYYVDTSCARSDISSYIPSIQGELIDSRGILLPSFKWGRWYTVVTAFSLEDPDTVTDSKAVFGAAGMCYVSSENFYVCENSWDSSVSSVNQTIIRKIAFQEGTMTAVGQTAVDGILNDSFSIDEYEGNLRLLTTVTPLDSDDGGGILLFGSDSADSEADEDTTYNCLYILDEELNECGSIEDLAPEETIHSARYMGDIVYFVTWLQTDPLFSADLSDPENPELIGELKITGFSEYLHPYGDGLLLGIGLDTDETGTTTNGVKLSMFDISDASDVEEIQKYVLEGTYYTHVEYDYKAAFIDVDKNLIGFMAQGDAAHYYIFSYENGEFVCRLDRTSSIYSGNVRALYVGDRLYIIARGTIEAYDLDSFEKLDDIIL